MRYSDLLVENREFFIPHPYLAPRRNFVKMFDAGKSRMIWVPYDKKSCDDILSRFHRFRFHERSIMRYFAN